MKNYTAITIGPIIDTLSIAGSPGTLWCASTMFSYLAGDLCERILDEIPKAEIKAPAYDKGFINTDGIGRFHDRIFFSCELERDDLAEKLNTVCINAKKALASHISDALGQKDEDSRQETERYISEYIQLNWMIADEAIAEGNKKNCILNLSQYLDCMELNTQRMTEVTKSPIIQLLSGTADGSNAYIYRHNKSACWLVPKNPTTGTFQLLKNDAVRDIEDIADPFDSKDGRKIHSYFAVVQSDGDNIGAFLASCPSDKVRTFSECCIDYAVKAAKRIGEYGGLTIYAGGDDLLFLAPLVGKDNKNLLELCSEITGMFTERFEKLKNNLSEIKTPTLSFGISVNYQRSPLYEALEDARNLLFGKAKTGDKNQIAMSMHKHSGQSVLLLLPNSSEMNTPTAKFTDLINKSIVKDIDKAGKALHSILYQLEVFRSFFIESRQRGTDTQNLYDNLFDAPAHDMGRDYINDIKKLGDAIAAFPTCRADDGKTSVTGEPVDVLTSMLRFTKLYTERGIDI